MAADWQGNFGYEYTDRNQPDVEKRQRFFEKLRDYDVGSVFEVGCNRGANLSAVKKALDCQVSGCDINNHALAEAESCGLEVYWESATDLDHACDEFDLVFTAGVLIHLNTPQLIECMREMNRISSGLVMFLEYKGDDIEIPYRGHRGALIKRDYGGIYQALFPDAELFETGFVPREQGFDDVTWWLFYDDGDSTSSYGFDEDAWEGDEESTRSTFITPSTGTVGAVRADRPTSSGNGAWPRERGYTRWVT